MANIQLNTNQNYSVGEMQVITKPYVIEVIRDSNVIITGNYEPRDPTILRTTDVGSAAYLDVEDIQSGEYNFTWSSINW